MAGGAGQGRDAPRGGTTAAGRSVQPRPPGGPAAGGTELGSTGTAPFRRSRSPNVRSENVPGGQRCQASGSAVQPASSRVTGSAARARSDSALRKAALLESKVLNRKKQMELQNTDVGRKGLDEESFSSASDHEHSARGKKYLKNKVTASGNRTLSNARSKQEENVQSPKKKVTVKPQLGLGSDEEELRELMERSLEFSGGKEDQRVVVTDSKRGGKSKTTVSSGMPPPSPKAGSPTEVSKVSSFRRKDSEKNVFGGVTSPTPSSPSTNFAVQHNMRAPSLSSFVKEKTVKVTLPRRGNTKQSQISLESDRSEIKSLDELFSEADHAEDSSSSSSNDFRPTILSLDDLAPGITSEAAELKQESTNVWITQESKRNPKKDTLLVEKDQTALKMPSAAFTVSGVNGASEADTEKLGTEEEISEHLSDVSAGFSRHNEDHPDCGERTVSLEYSEDFERSSSTTDRESVAKTSEECSESCTSSSTHTPSSPLPSVTRGRRDRVHRVTVKETAVQTVDPLFTYCWSKTNGSAVLDPPLGNSYVDPVPVARHVISTDALEALTAYSPSVLVLDAMLKQHLMLTQQFVETVHRLHSSLVESLEEEQFHYHTLEEAKEYIKNHKSPTSDKQASM